jgi:hemerythrin
VKQHCADDSELPLAKVGHRQATHSKPPLPKITGVFLRPIKNLIPFRSCNYLLYLTRLTKVKRHNNGNFRVEMAIDSSVFLPAALVLNVPEIDAQHQALFAQLEELKDLCVDANVLPCCHAEKLLFNLQEHFKTEEVLAIAAGYDFSVHGAKHEIMLRAIRGGITKACDGSSDVFGVLRYVEYWFERHIAEEDRALGEMLQLLNSKG